MISPPADTPAPSSTTTEPVALPTTTDDSSGGYGGSGYGTGGEGEVDTGSSTTAEPTAAAAPAAEGATGTVMQEAAPIMHARIPNYRLADGAVIERIVGNTTGIKALPLVWD